MSYYVLPTQPAWVEVADEPRCSPVHLVVAWVMASVSLGYFLPWAIAATRDKSASPAIALVCALTGWTGVGWLLALGWALLPEKRPTRLVAYQPPTYPPVARLQVTRPASGPPTSPPAIVRPAPSTYPPAARARRPQSGHAATPTWRWQARPPSPTGSALAPRRPAVAATAVDPEDGCATIIVPAATAVEVGASAVTTPEHDSDADATVIAPPSN